MLERELSKAREDLGKLKVEREESSEEAEDLRRKVERLEAERGSLAAAPRKRNTGFAVGVALAVVLVIVFIAERGYRKAQDAARQQIAAREVREARAESSAARARAEELERATAEARSREPSNPEAVPIAAVPVLGLTWAAKVKRAEGGPLLHGAPCEVRATMTNDGAVRANITCGDVVVYDWDAPLGPGLERRSCSFEGSTEGTLGLRCSDTGPRLGRPQLDIETLSNTATVWNEDGLRVELDVASAPRENGYVSIAATIRSGLRAGVQSGAGGFGRVVRVGRVTKVAGITGVERGLPCAIVVSPGEPPHACRAAIQCGERALYGGSGTGGFADCILQNGRPTVVTDSNPTSHGGDPKLDLDLVGNRAVVSDDSPEWSVTLALEPG